MSSGTVITPPIASERAHLRSLDGIRALAILTLVVGHAARDWPPLPVVGRIALPVSTSIVVLFVLTGFLVTRSLLAQWEAQGTIAIGRYWARKLVRAYPAFAVFVLVTTLHLLVNGVGVPAARVFATLALLGNYYYALASADESRHIIGHLWSFAVGAQFLVCWPWVLRTSLRRDRERALRIGVAVTIVLVALGRTAISWRTGIPEIYVYNATELRIDGLLVGALAALLQRSRSAGRSGARLGPLGAAALASAALVLSLVAPYAWRVGPAHTVDALLIAALVSSAISAERAQRWRWLAARPLRAVSLVSFSLFLWHLYPLAITGSLQAIPIAVRIPLVLGVVGVVGALAFLFLERPFIRLAGRIPGPGVRTT